MKNLTAFQLWHLTHQAPYHFPMDESTWDTSMQEDVDSDGRLLFDEIHTETVKHGMIQYGITAFGFDEAGGISDNVHYPVIRDLYFDPNHPEAGQTLLFKALRFFRKNDRIFAFFHYFGMSACARHGKLHESQAHIHDLLLENGFSIEHENVYYARRLTEADTFGDAEIHWKPLNAGSCREFAAIADGQEIGWGQVHFLPQGDIAYLRWIYIDETLQHRGYGSRVMRSLFAQLYAMGIRRFDTDTARDNLVAQDYYEKTGFRNEGITRSYYR